MEWGSYFYGCSTESVRQQTPPVGSSILRGMQLIAGIDNATHPTNVKATAREIKSSTETRARSGRTDLPPQVEHARTQKWKEDSEISVRTISIFL